MSADLLRLGIGYKLQEQKHGGLSRGTRSLLRQVAARAGEGASSKPLPRKLTPGTKLVRDWHGVGHTVTVLADGFEYNGKHWKTLTAVARAITGAHWNAMLRGLITDPQGRPMVPTYGSSKVKRYAYYETRKDLARPGDPPGLRFQRGKLEQHLLAEVTELLGDQHRLRRMTGLEDAGALRTLFATAHLLLLKLNQLREREAAIRALVKAITIDNQAIELQLDPSALGIEAMAMQHCSIPLPERKPFREARLRIDAEQASPASSTDLIGLLGAAMDAQRLMLGSPELSVSQLAKREGRCRTQLARLLRISFLSPRIVEAIAEGSQPNGVNRRLLLSCGLPLDWADQERMFGLVA